MLSTLEGSVRTHYWGTGHDYHEPLMALDTTRPVRVQWAQLWEEAQAAPQMGVSPAALEPGQGNEESAKQRLIDKQARMFARQGDLSKVMSVFDSDAVLDPTELDIWRQLEQLHDPEPGVVTRTDPTTPPPSLSLTRTLTLTLTLITGWRGRSTREAGAPRKVAWVAGRVMVLG